MAVVRRGEVYWVHLNPVVGSEIRKTRPALVVSPDDLNAAMPRVIVAPLTSAGQDFAFRPRLRFAGRDARILLDQIRSVDKRRLGECIGQIPESIWHPVLLELLA